MTATRRTASLTAAALAGALLLAACSGSEEAASTSSAASSSSTSSSSDASSSSSDSGSSSADPSSEPTEILAVLCDEATDESVAALEAAVSSDFSVSQVVDVRTDDAGMHAILAFVEGPGLAVLAQWTGEGLDLQGLAAADEFAAQVSDVPMATPDQATQDLLGQTVQCYTTLFAPDESGDKKKDKDKDKQ